MSDDLKDANDTAAAAIAEGHDPGEALRKRIANRRPAQDAEAGIEATAAAQGSERLLRTDTGNAELFARLYGDRLRYDHRRQCWRLWDRHWWVDDVDGEIRRLAKAVAYKRLESALAMEAGDGRQAEIKFALSTENRSRLDAMIALAQAERPIADAGDGWDYDPWLVGVSNGVIDLRDGTLRDGKPEDRITRHIEHAFDPHAPCTRWLRCLDEVFDGDEELIDFICRAAGYSITGDTSEQCLFVCHGTGSNGKSILLRTLRHAFGPYASDTPFTTFELTARVSIPNDVAALDGKRFVTSSETNEGTRLNEARVKALTGCDPITARFLNKEFFTFAPVCKLWLAVNHKPRVSDDSFGFWRRVRLIPFLRTFTGTEDDKHLDDKLKAEAEGILAWAVRGCIAWQERGLEAPAAVRAATEEYRAESDPLAAFLAESCARESEAHVLASELYKGYRAWAEAAGLREREVLSVQSFGRRIGETFKRERPRGVIQYIGLRLLDEHDRAGQ